MLHLFIKRAINKGNVLPNISKVLTIDIDVVANEKNVRFLEESLRVIFKWFSDN